VHEERPVRDLHHLDAFDLSQLTDDFVAVFDVGSVDREVAGDPVFADIDDVDSSQMSARIADHLCDVREDSRGVGITEPDGQAVRGTGVFHACASGWRRANGWG